MIILFNPDYSVKKMADWENESKEVKDKFFTNIEAGSYAGETHNVWHQYKYNKDENITYWQRIRGDEIPPELKAQALLFI